MHIGQLMLLFAGSLGGSVFAYLVYDWYLNRFGGDQQ